MEFVDIIIEYLPIFMFLAMGILLFIGYPVGFILGGVAAVSYTHLTLPTNREV